MMWLPNSEKRLICLDVSKEYWRVKDTQIERETDILC